MIDCHVHLGSLENIENLERLRSHLGARAMNLVCEFRSQTVNDNSSAFAAKAALPGRFYVFGGLDHSAHFSHGSLRPPSLEDQITRLIEIGADGIKMIENKPTARRQLDIPIDSDYFAGLFGRLEDTGFPLLWHVADPEEFWDPQMTPRWAAEKGWGYDSSFPPKEHLYAEVERVLERHPRLKVILAHFFFLSADLERAAALLDRYRGVHLDLAPGIELLYNMSRNIAASRRFFARFSDRILFGTDIWGGQSPEQAGARAGILRRWLETDDESRVPAEADALLGPPEDGLIRGLALDAQVLEQVLERNFVRLTGTRPSPLDAASAAEECDRIAGEVAVLGGDASDAQAAAHRLRGLIDRR